MNEKEAALRKALGIPDSATSVLILEQSAHCDWDWVSTFDTYYYPGGGYDPTHQAVRTTLEQAISYIGTGIANKLPYTYVFCEVAYLQKFMGDREVTLAWKHDLKQFVKAGLFRFASGGITSAENLTLHTEAFIRNYLIGRQWLKEKFDAEAGNQMWIPDDFGHDAQLPALLRAMGFHGAGFWRIPAQIGAANNSCNRAAGTNAAPGTYLQSDVGYDFLWQANDGSTIQAHWLAGGYCQGNGALGGTSTADESGIQSLITANTTPVMPTMYMFSPIDCDFATPYSNVPSIVQQYNTSTDPAPTAYVVMASFDAFMQLVSAASTNSDGTSTLQTVYPNASGPLPPFVPHPYYSGCYASKPFIKNTHYQVVRMLLFTESMELILQSLAQSSPSVWGAVATTALSSLATAWNEIAPSTHHDFIPGTSPNGTCGTGADVYDDEQVPRLQNALSEAQDVRAYVVSQLAGAITASNETTVAIFNGLGFARTAVAELLSPPIGAPFTSATADGIRHLPVQRDGNGAYLVQADVDSLGYTTITLGTNAPNVQTPLKASIANDLVTMSNGSISATIGVHGIHSLGAPDGASILRHLGNELRFYNDSGNIYRFGNELMCYDSKFNVDEKMVLEDATIRLTEQGPLRATAIVSGTVNGATFTVQYQLYATDTALRISVTGAAPSAYSVMVRFEFAADAASLTYATTSHWDTQAPRNYFVGPMPKDTEAITFEPTHEYVAALDANSAALGAVYHYATLAWGIDPSSALLGCILRNVPGTQNAACANDTGTYTISYAVALPGAPSMRNAALDVNNPLVAMVVPVGGSALPSRMSIASADNANALITAAKAGTVNASQMILRLYQPTNATLDRVRITLDSTIASSYQSDGKLVAGAVDALERPSNESLDILSDATTVRLDLQYAITTLALGG